MLGEMGLRECEQWLGFCNQNPERCQIHGWEERESAAWFAYWHWHYCFLWRCTVVGLRRIWEMLNQSLALPVTSIIKSIIFNLVQFFASTPIECARKVHISRGFAICFPSPLYAAPFFTLSNDLRWQNGNSWVSFSRPSSRRC